jgi:hypothetical protein
MKTLGMILAAIAIFLTVMLAQPLAVA